MDILVECDYKPVYDLKIDQQTAVAACLDLMHNIAKNQFAYDNGWIDKVTYANTDTGYNLELEDYRAYMRVKEMDDIPGDELNTYAVEAIRRRHEAQVELRTEAELEELKGKWSLLDEMKEEDLVLERARVTKEITSEVYFEKKAKLLERFMPVYNFCIVAECVDTVKLAGMN